ncbi:hypothetical protein [Pseudomonas sp. CGJS7]|uniref:hypothetical protein n=1 Tax=Pseudomonas sp. CGJS7 TaxID=3109348 RepID=UPI00300824FC
MQTLESSYCVSTSPVVPVIDRALDPTRRWFGIKAILAASMAAPLVGGLLMIALNFLAQQRRMLAATMAALAVLVCGPLVWVVGYTVLVFGYQHSTASVAASLLLLALAPPLVVWGPAYFAQGPEISARLKSGLPMRSRLDWMVVVGAGWAVLALSLVLLIATLRVLRLNGG